MDCPAGLQKVDPLGEPGDVVEKVAGGDHVPGVALFEDLERVRQFAGQDQGALSDRSAERVRVGEFIGKGGDRLRLPCPVL